jgi:hypothetical protein
MPDRVDYGKKTGKNLAILSLQGFEAVTVR